MHQLGRLKRVIGALVAEQTAGETAEFAVDHPDQSLERLGISGIPPIEQPRDVIHSGGVAADSSSPEDSLT